MSTASTSPSKCPFAELGDNFNLSNQDLAAVMRNARSQEPVTYLEEIDFWAVTRHADIKQILNDTENFSAEITLNPLLPLHDSVVEFLKQRKFAVFPVLSNNTTESHPRIRRQTQRAFSPVRIKKLESYIRQLVHEAVDSFEQDKHADLVGQMVYELPALVLFKLLGIPDEDVAEIKGWADKRLLLTFGKLDEAGQLEAAREIADYWDYCVQHVQRKVREPGDDLPSDMLANSDEPLSHEEITCVMFGLLLAGHETTTNASANTLHVLLEHRDAWTAICEDPGKIPDAIEESLRYRPSVVAWRRLVRQPVTVAGVDLEPGSRLLLFLASANRDENLFEDGETYDIERKNARDHIAFGFGQHFCLGAPLARYELQIILEELSQRLPNLRLSESCEYNPIETIQFRGPQTLNVVWD